MRLECRRQARRGPALQLEAFTIIATINLGSLIGVRMSIIDPWGWFIEETNTLFFPSLTVFAACLLLIAFRSDESLVLDRRRAVDVAA